MLMRTVFLSVGVLACASIVHAEVVIETVTVGNPGNAGELSGLGAGGSGPDCICGAVDYVYNIGKFEVTAGQYIEFLNAVAATDTYGLYSIAMAASPSGCKITPHGDPGSHTYDFSVRPSGTEADWADRPVNFVSWGSAARFCNWLHNGQPTGAQDLSTTEDGSYFLDGVTSNLLMAVSREDDATWVIPSEDEWYKAAYHKNDGVTGNYFDYATRSDSIPSNDLLDPDPGNNATYRLFSGEYTIGSPYFRTEVGAHENSESTYGTFDQSGNVEEWNEAKLFGASTRGIRGESFADYVDLAADNRNAISPTGVSPLIGFRVVDAEATCGNGSIEQGEECDGGLGCTACLCDEDFEPADPPSLDCEAICGNGSIDPGEECDGGLDCTDECLCGEGFESTEPISFVCQAVEMPVTGQQPPLKNRYISLDRDANLESNFDIRLTLTSTLVNGITEPSRVGSVWWANAPDAACISIVGPDQPGTTPNWSPCDVVHLTGCAIIPTTTYDIVAINLRGSASVSLVAETQLLPANKWWGDAVGIFNGVNWSGPNGVTNFDDVTACLKTFNDPNAINATHVSWTDIHPNRPDLGGLSVHPNKLVNFDDVSQFINAFGAAEYPGGDLASCTNP